MFVTNIADIYCTEYDPKEQKFLSVLFSDESQVPGAEPGIEQALNKH